MNLLIVESPHKIKKLKSLLPGWEVAASVGHVCDLPPKKLGIDLEKGFKPSYQIDREKRQAVSRLKALVKKVGKQNVYLATDPDREGEAISYHLCRVLGLDLKTTKRVSFDALSKGVVERAIATPKQVDTKLVAAQESRRVIDRLVGYQVSPILWKAIESDKALSAGRVQSVGLRLVVEQEEKIEKYKPLKALELKGVFLTPYKEELSAKYIGSLPSGMGNGFVRDFLNGLARRQYQIRSIEKKEKEISPKPPFSTASLHQAANTQLRYSVKKCSALAQSLFEKGFVSYIRTDSVNISEEAQALVGDYIKKQFGEDQFVARSFRAKAGAQEAHEAIRPLVFEGEKLAELSKEELSLYELIKARAIASQMAAKVLDLTQIKIGDQEDLFEARIQVVKEPGWTVLYKEEKQNKEEQAVLLHPIADGDRLGLVSIRCIESFKDLPKRFDEAALVKELEKRAIGRPSTYGSIIGLLFWREYVKIQPNPGKAYQRGVWEWKKGKIEVATENVFVGKDKGKMVPSLIGRQVLAFLRDQLSGIIAYDFTANWELRFDQVALGNGSYEQTVSEFYASFSKWLAQIELADKKQTKAPLGEYEGKEVRKGKSKFGVYIKWADRFFDTQESLPEIDLGRAIEIIQAGLRKKVSKALYCFGDIEVLKGKYGLYLKKGSQTASLPKWEQEKLSEWDKQKAEQVFAAQLAYKQKRKSS